MNYQAAILALAALSGTKPDGGEVSKANEERMHIISADGLMVTLSEEVKDRRGLASSESNGRHCTYANDGKDYRCVGTDKCGRASYYLKPYPLYSVRAPDCPGLEPVVRWVDPSLVLGGTSELASQDSRLSAGSLCQNERCYGIFRINEVELDHATVRGLARCEQYRVGRTLGAPTCDVVRLEVGEKSLLPAVIGYVRSSRIAGRPDYKIAVYTKGQVSDNILGGVGRSLQSRLKLAVDPKVVGAISPSAGGMLIAVADARWSEMFEHWERVTVRMDRYATPGSGDESGIPSGWHRAAEYFISVDLMLNRTATDRPTDWHPPTPLQAGKYVTAVRAAVSLGIDASCKNAQWIDAERVLCSPR